MKCGLSSFVPLALVPITVLFISLAERGSSIHVRKTNRTCTSDMDCVPAHSSCYQASTCHCDPEYIAVNRTKYNNFECLPAISQVGDRCVHDLQCEVRLGVHAGCVMLTNSETFGTCHCKPKHHLVRGICHPTSHIGDFCKVSDDCYLPSKNLTAYCYKSVCRCPPGYDRSKDGVSCVMNKGLLGPCQDDDDCQYPNSRCSERGECICQENYYMNNQKTECGSAATQLGDHCNSNIECNILSRETVCDEKTNKCVCNYKSQAIGGKCYRITRLGDMCYERLDCVIPSDIDRVDCVGYTCRCNSIYTRFGHDCLLDSEIQALDGRKNSSQNVQAVALNLMLCWALLSLSYSTRY